MEKCRRMKRPQCSSKNWTYCWKWRPREHASSFIARKALRWQRIFCWMDQWSQTTSHLKRDSDTMQHGKLRSDRGSRLVNEFVFRFLSVNFKDTFKAGDWSSSVFLKFVYFTDHNSIKRQWDSREGRSEWDRFPSSACVKFTRWRDDRTGRPVVDQANQKSKTK